MNTSSYPYQASIIVPLWGRADRTLGLVNALARTLPPAGFEIVFVDNGSRDATPDVLGALQGDVQVVRHSSDIGFSRSCNDAVALSKGHHLVFLDARCIPLPGWIEALLAPLMAHVQVGAVGPRIVHPDGTIISAGLLLCAKEGNSTLEARARFAGWPADDPRLLAQAQVRGTSSTAMAVRRAAFEEVGGFEASYADGSEDIDLCLSLTAAGWKIVYEPGSCVVAPEASARPADPSSTRSDAERLGRRWAAQSQLDLVLEPDGELRPARSGVIRRISAGSWGANVVGFFEAELGIGQAARLLVEALEQASVDCSTFSYYRHFNRADHRFEHRRIGADSFDVNVICINGDLLPSFAREHGRDILRDRYTVGMWHWELEELPISHVEALALLDEVWVGSAFTRECIRRYTEKPVTVLPLPITLRTGRPQHNRQELDIPEGFVFGFMYDLNSVTARKNPEGLISAFCRAFDPDEGPRLLIKTINGDQRPEQRARLESLSGGRADVILADRYLSTSETQDWSGLVDCYVSLHRSEGFGLTLAEAMSWGTPVIATAFSGNLDFMTPENSYLLPWSEATVPAGAAPYPAGARWAEPDLEAAAAALRHVWEHPEEARARGARGQEDIRSTHGLEAAARVVRSRFAQIERHVGCQKKSADVQKSEIAVKQPWEDPRPAQQVTKVRAASRPPRRASQAAVRLNIGAGEDRRDGFLSVDLREDVADLVAPADRLPYADETVDEILASDILEHFPADRTRGLLDEWHRVLVPGGKLTLRVPNLLALANLLVTQPHMRVDIIRNIYGGHRWGPDGAWDTHHTGWTPEMLHSELADTGFLVLTDDGQLNNTVMAMRLPRVERGARS